MGYLLELPINELEAIEMDHRRVNECWNAIMTQWLRGMSQIYPPTWEGLFMLLEDAEFNRVAKELSKAVASACPIEIRGNTDLSQITAKTLKLKLWLPELQVFQESI